MLTPLLSSLSGCFATLLWAATETIGSKVDNTMKFLIFVAIVVVSIAAGRTLARSFRLPEHAWRIGVVIFSTLIGLAITVLYWPPKLGIDLSGGAILVYELDQTKLKPDQPVNMDELIAALSKRVNPGGQKEITLRKAGNGGVEIIVPEVDQDELTRLKGTISSIGTLEFRIVANTTDHAGVIERANRLKLEETELIGKELNRETGKEEDKVLARWVPLVIGKDGQPVLRREAYPDLSFREVPEKGGKDKVRYEVLVDLSTDRWNVTGDYLSNTRAGVDQKSGQPCVHFQFNSAGAAKFAALTGKNKPDQNFTRKLAIILDGNLNSAPSIQDVISDSGQITGDFDEKKVAELVGVLNAGRLPATLSPNPISEQIIGPTLGIDTIRNGTIATVASVVIVVLFMIFYYRFAGVVAAAAVVLNVLLTLAVAMIIKAPFTLPGLAGLALTLGMAVDANVLIYERLREEMHRGATLRMAIRNGFSRAMTTIIDSNLTTLITATVLYWIGTDQIKGFAVMLWLGLVISMFTACFCARVIFDIWEKMRWLTKLDMMQMFGVTHIDFVGAIKACLVGSWIVIAIGMVAVAQRGKGMLNIDFTGGTQVEFIFKEPTDIAGVRQKLEEKPELFPDATVIDFKQGDELKGLRFRVETSNLDKSVVESELAKSFPGQLASNTLLAKEVALLPREAAPETKTPPPATPDKPAGDAPGETKPPATEQPKDEDESPKSSGDAPEEPADDKPSEEPSPPPADEPTQKKEGAAVRPRSELQFASLGGTTETLLTLAALNQAESTEEKKEAPAEGEPTAAEVKEQEETAPVSEAADAPATDSPEQPAPPREAFDGKTLLKFRFKEPITHGTMEDQVRQGFESAEVKERGIRAVPFEVTNDEYKEGSSASFAAWEVRLPLSPEDGQALLSAIEARMSSNPYFPSSSNIGGKVAGSACKNALFALFASFLFITLYLWVRFQKVMYGVAAVVALVHDVLIATAFLAVSYYVAPLLGWALVDPFKIDLSVVAALLTIVGFSVNDTVVVFDRMREVKGKSPQLTAQIINDSVNQTLSRTVLTSLTVFLVTVILYIWGGSSIHAFAFTFLIGVLTGTYSSVYIAAPLLLWMSGKSKKTSGSTAGASSGGALSKSA